MEPGLFAIVLDDDPWKVYSYGIELGEEEAFTFRRDPVSQTTQFTTHASADEALALAKRLTRSAPINLVLRWFDVTDPITEAEIEKLEAWELQQAAERAVSDDQIAVPDDQIKDAG